MVQAATPVPVKAKSKKKPAKQNKAKIKKPVVETMEHTPNIEVKPAPQSE